MNKRKARKLIIERKRSLNITVICTQQWIDRTHEVLRRVFGTNDDSLVLPMYGSFYNLTLNRQNPAAVVRELDKFFDEWIALVNDGLYKVDEKSFVDGFKNTQLRKWGISIAIVCVILGYVFGAYNNPKNILYRFIKSRIENTINDGQTKPPPK